MPLVIPNLDDRTYSDLVEEGLGMIPRFAPDWTNHNASDPGLTLVELLAYFTELMMYRLNRVSRENRLRFLQLLRGAQWDGAEALRDALDETLEAEWQKAVKALWEPQRAVTVEDFEYLARRILGEEIAGSEPPVVRCLMNQNLAAQPPQQVCRGHVSLVVVIPPETEHEQAMRLREILKIRLAPMCLLTVRLHIVPPSDLFGSVRFRVMPRRGFSEEEAQRAADSALRRRFDPAFAKEQKNNSLGRNLYLSELIELLERVPEVDAVEGVRLSRVSHHRDTLQRDESALGVQLGLHSTLGRDARLGVHPKLGRQRLLRNDAGALIGFALRSFEVFRVVEAEADRPPVYEVREDGWP